MGSCGGDEAYSGSRCWIQSVFSDLVLATIRVLGGGFGCGIVVLLGLGAEV